MGRSRTTQDALETVAEGGPLSGVLDFLCRTMEAESADRVVACRCLCYPGSPIALRPSARSSEFSVLAACCRLPAIPRSRLSASDLVCETLESVEAVQSPTQ